MTNRLDDAAPYARSQVLALMLDELRTGPVPAPGDGLAPATEPVGDGIRLPQPTPASIPVGIALRARRAHRFYADRPIAQGDLHAVLAAACTGTDAELGAIVAARHVDGLPPAVYRFHASGGRLETLSSLTGDPAELESCVLQREFAAAPAIVVVTGRLARASAGSGARGYARLMTRGAEATADAWTAGVRRGLVGSTFAGLLQPSLRSLAGIDGYSEIGVLGLALGLPLPTETTRTT